MKTTFKVMRLAVILCMISLSVYAQKHNKRGEPQVKNIIFMIGDGMGLGHVSATTINQDYQPLNLERAQYIGIAKTYSANNRVTDSAAAGTALATGTKTYNGAIGVDVDKKPLRSILEAAEDNGLATGLVVTCAVTHATPATFIAHVDKRKNQEDIAEYFLTTDIDVFIGGGKQFFTERADGRDLTKDLTQKGYTIASTIDEVMSFDKVRLGALLASNYLPSADERGDYLPQATAKALDILKRNSPKGFFIMIEGSQIDGVSHSNDIDKVIEETIDFDKAVKVAFDFADNNPGTLVVVTADHETGGLTIPSGKEDFSLSDQGVLYKFSTHGHTGTFVPIYAYGAGAANFSRIMDNTDIPKTMKTLLRFK